MKGYAAHMGLGRTLLRPAARLAGLHASGQLRQFLHAHRNGRAVQDKLLRRLLRHFERTRFARDHGLAAVRGYDDFRRAVPLGDYDSLAPYLRAVYEGNTAALLPPGEEPLMFALSSGTTGEPKRIPVTPTSLAHYRRGWNVFGMQLLRDHPRAWLRKILQVAGSAAESYSPSGVPCGSISGMLAACQKPIVRRMYAAPAAAAAIDDADARYYTIMRLAMPQDVGWISTANPSTVVRLFSVAQANLERLLRDLNDGELTPPGGCPDEIGKRLRPGRHPALVRRIERGVARDGRLLARHFWDLAVCLHWTGGTLSLYLPRVRELLARNDGDVPIRDIGLLASEGRLSVPLADETPDGVAEILGNFLEFIPADEIDSPQPAVLRTHELTPGQEYFVVLSNFSGLWRYNIHDRVRVTGFLGRGPGASPVFRFLSRGEHTVSLTGEKLTEHQVVAAMESACGELGLSIERFWAQGHFPGPGCGDEPPYYRFTVESLDGRISDPADRLADRLEGALGRLNIEYASKRSSGRLGPPRIAAADTETFERHRRQLLQDRPGRQEQYKHQYLLTEVAT